jgi:hypothetical protein
VTRMVSMSSCPPSTTPAIRSLWPLRYFVALCRVMSKPSLAGCRFTGDANVAAGRRHGEAGQAKVSRGLSLQQPPPQALEGAPLLSSLNTAARRRWRGKCSLCRTVDDAEQLVLPGKLGNACQVVHLINEGGPWNSNGGRLK